MIYGVFSCLREREYALFERKAAYQGPVHGPYVDAPGKSINASNLSGQNRQVLIFA
jgi:hypothetical protein